MRGRRRAIPISPMFASGVGVWLLLTIAPGPSASGQTTQTDGRTADHAAALRSADTPAGAWKQAAARLLKESGAPEARAALQAALWDNRPPGVRRAVAEAVADDPGHARTLVRSLGTALAAAMRDETSRHDAAPIIAALACFRTKEAAQAIVDGVLVDPDAGADLTDLACDALAEVTGRRTPGRDRAEWLAWWNSARWLDEQQWEADAASSRAAPAAPAPAEESEGDRLASLYRRLHAVTPEAAREKLLIEMLEAPEAAVRLAAFDLIMLSLVNARPVGEGAVNAAAARLEDPSPLVRAQAARTAELLGGAAATDSLLTALRKEDDPWAASAMLRAAARRPDARLIEPALRWFETPDGETWAAACESLDAAKRAGLLNDEPVRDRLMRALSLRPIRSWPKPAFRLALAIGAQDVVRQVLLGDDRVTAIIAGEALSESRIGVEELLSAASRRADLFPAAASAILVHAPTAAGYARLSALPAAVEADRQSALLAVAGALPPDELLMLARSQPDHAQRELLLSPLVTQEFLAATDDLAERVEVALVLARTRLVLGRPSDALATLQILPTDWQGPRALALRVTALLCLGRVEDAEAAAPLPAPTQPPTLSNAAAADAWLEALEMCRGKPDDPERLAAFERRFVDDLTPEQLSRFNALRAEPSP